MARLDIKVNIVDNISCSCGMQYLIKVLDIFAYRILVEQGHNVLADIFTYYLFSVTIKNYIGAL